jgi:dienelactone hydrolase
LTDADLLLDLPQPEYGSGIIGVCDVCGKRQAVIVLARERFKLCVIDFLNKAWIGGTATPGAPLPPYRSERIWYPTTATPNGRAPAILLRPTRIVRHPAVLVTPEVHGLTTAVLDAGIRFAREGFEVLLPDIDRAGLVGPRDHLALRLGARGGGVPSQAPGVVRLTELYSDGLDYLQGLEMIDTSHLAVAGLSYGASLAMVLAAQDQRLSALALAYPAPVRPPELVKLISAPTFFVAGANDRLAARAREQLSKGLAPELWHTYEAGPVGHHFLARDLSAYRMPEAEAAWKAIEQFLHARLMPPPPKPPAPPPASKAAAVATTASS